MANTENLIKDFDDTVKEAQTADFFILFSYGENLSKIIEKADKRTSVKLLDKALKIKEPLKSVFCQNLGVLAKHSHLRPQIYKFIKTIEEPKNDKEVKLLAKITSDIVINDPERNEKHLKIIENIIKNEYKNLWSLHIAYNALSIIRKNKNLTEKADEILNYALTLDMNNDVSLAKIHRALGNYEELYSKIAVVKNITETDNQVQNVSNINPDKPCVLVIGGEATTSKKAAIGYFNKIKKLLIRYNLTDKINLYSVLYDFGSSEDKNITINCKLARKKLMKQYKRNLKIEETLNQDTLNPRYIKQLFNIAVLPRICDDNGNRLSVEEAQQRIRKLNIVAHCHGAYTFLKLEEMMQHRMQELGYSKSEQNQIQKQLLCLAHAPYCPLGVSKSTMISFCSAKDTEVNHHNRFYNEILQMSTNEEVKLSYFPKEKGEFFLTPSYDKNRPVNIKKEHNFLGYDTDTESFSEDGNTLIFLSKKALINSIKSSLNNENLPQTTKELVRFKHKNFDKAFDEIEKNGQDIYNRICKKNNLNLNISIRNSQSR